MKLGYKSSTSPFVEDTWIFIRKWILKTQILHTANNQIRYIYSIIYLVLLPYASNSQVLQQINHGIWSTLRFLQVFHHLIVMGYPHIYKPRNITLGKITCQNMMTLLGLNTDRCSLKCYLSLFHAIPVILLIWSPSCPVDTASPCSSSIPISWCGLLKKDI